MPSPARAIRLGNIPYWHQVLGAFDRGRTRCANDGAEAITRGVAIKPRFTLLEMSGALGDLGTLLPLVAALIMLNGMEATAVFLTVGVAYLVAGVYYRVPVPVQPLKAMAAIAIASGLSGSVVSAAGLAMGGILLALAASGLITRVAGLFGKPVIRGIQLGLALLLIQTGFALAAQPKLVMAGAESVVRLGDVPVPLGLPVAGLVCLFLVWRSKRRPLPVVLVALVFGIGLALVSGALDGLGALRFGLALPRPQLPSLSDLGLALTLLVVPQIPLTLANSVVAAQRTAEDYFGSAAKRVTNRALLATMGIVNLAAGVVGGLPVCHGSGGMTAHYRFGARTGGAPIMIGLAMMALALFVDGNVVPVLALIPYPVLGALLVVTGIQHALLARDLRRLEEIGLAAVVGAVGFGSGNLAIGFGVGLVVQAALSVRTHFMNQRAAA